MNARPRLFILIPVLNEAANLPRLLPQVGALCRDLAGRFETRLLLIDDGSRDGTAAFAERDAAALGLPLEVLRHERNLGPGAAFRTGFAHLAPLLRPDDFVLTMEGDNTSRLELVRQMFHRQQEGFDVIFASPYLYGGGIVNTSAVRVFLSAMANVFVKEALGLQGLATVSSFFRLYRGAAVQKLQAHYGNGIVERNGFECMVEMAIKMVLLRMTISEVPMILDTKARIGKSRMKILRTIGGYLVLWRLKRKWERQALRA